MDKIELLRRMKEIRCVEETIAARYAEQKMRCPTHLSIGQELVGAAAGMIMTATDLAVSTHRGHAHYLGKGGSIPAMIAEIYGKETGCARGRGGSMHLIDQSVGFMGTTAIVGNSIPIGTGLALSKKLDSSTDLSCVFLGDGATEEGAFYESANFAVVQNLPLLFLCENNLYSVYTSLKPRQPEGRVIHELAKAIGLTVFDCDGTSAHDTYQTISAAVQHIRSGNGPAFVEISTYRWREHCGPNYDNDLPYRDEAEYETWKAKDALDNFELALKTDGTLTESSILQMEMTIQAVVNEAFDFAERSPWPDQKEAFIDEYAVNEATS